MKVLNTDIEGAYIFIPDIYFDKRGYFYESFNQKKLEPYIGNINFVQDNQSRSSKNVLRGLHFQKDPYAQSKLVRCIEGTVYDVAVDLRYDSPTYKKWFGVILSDLMFNQFFIPKGCAHGFVVLSDSATFQYKVDEYWHQEAEDGINPFDPQFNIDWKISKEEAILSDKDINNKNYERR